MGKNVSVLSYLHGKLNDRGYLQNVNKLCLAQACSLWYLTVYLKPFLSNYNGKKMLIRDVQVAHNVFTILLYNSALLSGQPKLKPEASMPSGLLAQLTTLRKNEYGSLVFSGPNAPCTYVYVRDINSTTKPHF